MNYTQSFEEFSSTVGPTDLALYAGVGVILYVLFKDKLSPVQKMLLDLFETAKDTVSDLTKHTAPASTPVSVTTNEQPIVGPIPTVPPPPAPVLVRPDDVFISLVSSWKQTRDLAAQNKCESALKALDDAFKYLSPTVCQGDSDE